ncbi:MAG: hypothetical protein ACI4LM_07130, partial [Anaerovoracaceae bacterium]
MEEKTEKKDLSAMTADELRDLIESTKKEIKASRKTIEDPTISTGGKALELTDRITSMLGRLEEAEDAYVRAGGEYEPTEEEKKDREFTAKVPSISQIIFSVNGSGYGYMNKIFRIGESSVVSKTDKKLITEAEGEDPDDHEIMISTEDFLKGMKDLHIWLWKDKYQLSDYGYMLLDGT